MEEVLMNHYISNVFENILTILHFIVLTFIVVFLLVGDGMFGPMFLNFSTRLFATFILFIFYVVTFGTLTTLVVIRSELVSINARLKRQERRDVESPEKQINYVSKGSSTPNLDAFNREDF